MILGLCSFHWGCKLLPFTVLRESNGGILLLLLIVCAPDLTKACRDSLLHSVHPEVLEPQNGVVLQWPQRTRCLGFRWRGQTVRRGPLQSSVPLCLLLCVVCHPSEFWIIRFIYYSVVFLKHISVCLWNSSHLFPIAFRLLWAVEGTSSMAFTTVVELGNDCACHSCMPAALWCFGKSLPFVRRPTLTSSVCGSVSALPMRNGWWTPLHWKST